MEDFISETRNVDVFNGKELIPTSLLRQFNCYDCKISRTNQPNLVGSISPLELSRKLARALNLNNEIDFILVDARDSTTYCSRHIISAINFNCHSKIMVRRAVKLWSERFSSSNQCPAPRSLKRCATYNNPQFSNALFPTLHSHKSFCANCTDRQRSDPSTFASIIVYDETGDHLLSDSPIKIFLNHLTEQSNNVLFLEGGMKGFLSYSGECEDFLDYGPDTSPMKIERSTCRSSLQIGGENIPIECLPVSSASRASNVPKRPKPSLKSHATFPPQFSWKPLIPPVVLQPNTVVDGDQSKCHSGTSDVYSAVISQVLPHLFLGNARDAQDKDLLKKLHITHILNVTDSLPNAWENNFEYMRLPAVDDDRQNLKPQFDCSFRFIEKAKANGGRVLVHCQAGVSRSVTIVIAYLLRCDREITLMDALDKVQEVRPIAGPNLNFMGQLQAYHRELKGRNSPSTILGLPRTGSHDSLKDFYARGAAADSGCEQAAKHSPAIDLSPISSQGSDDVTTPQLAHAVHL
ncbi:Dual specificity protein phosphatase 16 [Cichlidogyrus casuarinus]|uniref:protein-tyrosine-phosphatase n=1 Tax=Cichlidogyrus casuarinus TaxID=1844966 RepID=A0ABD2PWT5_9PLAT